MISFPSIWMSSSWRLGSRDFTTMLHSQERAVVGSQSGRVTVGLRGMYSNRLITRTFLAWEVGLTINSSFCCKTESFPFTIYLRFNRSGRAVYVCLCNCVTDRQLVEAAAEFTSEPGTESSGLLAEQVADRLGAGLGCGSCREFALDLVNRVATRQSSVVLPDHVSTPIGLTSSRQCGLPFQHAASGNHDALAYRGE